MAEALLPDTDAIQKETLEWSTYRGAWLVRYKDRAGMVHRTQTKVFAEVDAAFDSYLHDMRKRLYEGGR